MSRRLEDRDQPVYTIGTVARELGVAPNTLRSWEDRYASVVPARDSSGRRRYTSRQLADLRWLKMRIDEGLSPSEAHQLLAERRPSGPVVPMIPTQVGEDSIYVVFAGWVASHRQEIRAILGDVREAIAAVSAFVEVNIPHPEFGLTSSLMVRSTIAEREHLPTLARFVGVAWSELPEAAEALERGETHQFRFSELSQSGQDLFRPTDLRAEMNAPIHHASLWLGAVGVGCREERRWSRDEERVLERTRDLISAEFRAWQARSRFDHTLTGDDGGETGDDRRPNSAQ